MNKPPPSSNETIKPTSGPDRSRRHFLLFVLCFYAAWGLRVVLLLPCDKLIQPDWLRQCWSQSLRMLLWILPAAAYLALLDRVGPLSFVRLTTRPRRILTAGCVIAAYLITSAVIALLLQGAKFDNVLKLSSWQWANVLISTSFVAFAEEFLYRGFFFRKLRQWNSFHHANLMTSLLFLLIHWPGWLDLQGLHGGLLPLSVSILIISLALGWLMEYTQSLWPPIVLHFANNILSGVLLH